MERQRVVHYAKRRTAKVLEPMCTSRPLTSSPRSPLESPHAPLASIDSDFIVITKKRDRTNMAPNVWEQIGKTPPPQGDNISIVQAVATESTILDFANSLSDQHIRSQPRTYIKLRSTQTLDVQKPGLGNKDKKNYSSLPERHSLHQGPSRTSANNNRSFTTSPLDTNDLGHITRDIVTVHNDTTVHKKAESIGRNGVTLTSRPTSSNMNQTFPRSSRELLKLPSRKFPKPDVSVHEGGPMNSSPSFQASNGVRHEDIQARTIHRDDRTNLDVSTTNNRNIKSGYNCSTPHVQSDLTVARDTNNSENDIIHNNFSVLVSQYKTDIGNDQSSEISSLSSEVGFASKQLNSGITANCYSKSKDKFNDSVSSGHTGLHTTNNTCFHSNNKYGERNTSLNGNLSGCKKQVEPRSENPHLVKSESKSCDSRDVPGQISLSDNSFGIDSKPNWKRESMILATHGHSSVADLDDSFEYLTIKTENNVSNGRNVCRDEKQGQKLLGSVLDMEDYSTQSHFADKNECLPFRNTGANITNPKQLRKFNDILNIHKQEIDATEENKSQKLSFKLAALGIGDVWIIQRDGCDPLSNSNGSLDNAKTHRISTSADSQRAKIYDTNKCSQVDRPQDSRASISGNVRTQNFCSDDLNYDQQLRKLHKHLSKLETSSVSDLASSDDNIDNKDYLETFSLEHGQVKELSPSSVTSSGFITPKYHRGRLRDESFSSGQYSSAGSFHSCQSGGLSPQPSANSNIRQLTSTHMHHPLSSRRSNASEDSRNSDDSLSGDTSYYYTAADSSFLTEDGASRIKQTKRGLHKSPSNSQTSEFARKCNQTSFHNQTQVGSSLLRANLQSQRGKSPRLSNPNPVLLCYNCILGDEMSLQMQVRQHRKISRVISDRIWVYPEYARGGLSVNRRSKSVPSIRRSKTKHSDASARTSSRVQKQTYAEESMPQNDRSSLKSVQRSSVSSSRSVLQDSELFNLPRLPPSLGRPRRKMYAGFDSQPLPMDSFLSDSSSVYSTQSCSSWGTSRSATVESRSRSPDISSNIRAISSTASSTITPTAPLSQDNVFDFFAYSDKRSSTFPNNHNVYFKRESSCTEDFVKDNLYYKSCSKESLQSFLSDGTTVDAELTLKKQTDCVGPFSDLSEVRILNNGVLAGNRGHSVEGQQLNRLSNSCSSVFGSRLCNNGSYFAVFGTDSNGTGRKKVKASLSRQQVLSKRKYFSTRDILELVRISEKKFKRRTRSLERGLGK